MSVRERQYHVPQKTQENEQRQLLTANWHFLSSIQVWLWTLHIKQYLFVKWEYHLYSCNMSVYEDSGTLWFTLLGLLLWWRWSQKTLQNHKLLTTSPMPLIFALGSILPSLILNSGQAYCLGRGGGCNVHMALGSVIVGLSASRWILKETLIKNWISQRVQKLWNTRK